MNARFKVALPNGAIVTTSPKTAAWVWAQFYAHAACGMGLQIDADANGVRVQSVYAPLWCGLDITINHSGEITLCNTEQQSLGCYEGHFDAVTGDDWRQIASHVAANWAADF